MSNIILVTGGARSGKSSFAESLCIKQNNKTAYILMPLLKRHLG